MPRRVEQQVWCGRGFRTGPRQWCRISGADAAEQTVDVYLGAVIEALKIEAGDAGGLARHHTTWILWRDILRACRFGWDLGRPAGSGRCAVTGIPARRARSSQSSSGLLRIALHCSAIRMRCMAGCHGKRAANRSRDACGEAGSG
jgi:hypothetical protein